MSDPSMRYLFPLLWTVSWHVYADEPAPDISQWEGVYTSTSEIGAFTGTVLSIRVSDPLSPDEPHKVSYTARYYTDVQYGNLIHQDLLFGTCLVDKNQIYIPKAHGWQHGDDVNLRASVTRYTCARINGHRILATDYAIKLYRSKKKLYDYGFLVKVSDKPLLLPSEFEKVRAPSVKVLHTNPNKPWRDPFVYGPYDVE